MSSTVIVYGVVRGGPGTSGQAIAYNGAFWVPAAALPTGSPGTAQSAWNDGDTIQIAVPAPSSSGGGGGSGSGSTVTTAGYTQPAHGSTVIANVADATNAAVGNTATVAGTQKYTVTNVATLAITLLNDTLTNSVSGTIASGAVVVFAGPSLPNLVAPRLFTDLATTQPVGIRGSLFTYGYAAAADGDHGTWDWTLGTFTSNGGTIAVPAGQAGIGAWVRRLSRNTYHPTMFGAKGDGVTDDTAAIQSTVNAMYPAGNGEIYFPAVGNSSTTYYLISRPIFLGPGVIGQVGAMKISCAPNVVIKCTNQAAFFAFVSSNQFTQPTYGVQNGLTYCLLGPNGLNNWNLAYTAANNIRYWGNGNVAQLTATFIQPALGGGSTVATVNSTAIYGPNTTFQTIYIQGSGLFNVEVLSTTTLLLQNFLGPVLATDAATGATIPIGAALSAASDQIGNAPQPGFTFECFIDPIVDFPGGSSNGVVASSCGGLGSIPSTNAFLFQLYNDQLTSQTRVEANLTSVGTNLAGTASVTNASEFFTFSTAQTLPALTQLTFSSQPGVVYTLLEPLTAGTSAQLTTYYKGPTAGSATAARDASTLIQGGAATLTAGTMKHVALVYDGVSTMSLYVAGTRAATTTVHGPIPQGWAELFTLGIQTTSTYPSAAQVGGLPQNIKLAGVCITGIAKYSGASFTPPTSVPAPVSRIKSTVIDFANRTVIAGPNGVDHGQGWIQITIPSQSISITGVPAWLPSPAGSGLAYCAAPYMEHVTIQQDGLGGGVYLFSALNGIFDRLNIGGGSVGITFDGFSYRNTVRDPNINMGTVRQQYSWCVGALQGSQYITVEHGYLAGGAWQIVSDVYSGVTFKGAIWCEVTSLGGLLLAGQNSPVATWDNIFFQSDLGTSSEGVACVYLSNIDGVVGEGGFIGATALNQCPQLVIDNCRSVVLDGAWFGPVNGAGVGQPLIKFINQTTPVRVNSVQAYGRLNFGGYNYHPINASTTVSASSSGAPAIVGVTIQFNSQPNTTYMIAAVNAGTGALTIKPAYSGTSTVGALITTVAGQSWMPETGSSGQGPLYLVNQEEFGINTINMVAAAGMTLFMVDFLWHTAKFTDVDGLLGAGPIPITLPLITGYTRAYINTTSKTLRFAGLTGGHVDITAGSSARILCDGANWLAAP